MSQDYLGKVAIVTGSNSGIGEAIALELARRGASVTLCGRDVTRLEAARDRCIQASGGNHQERFFSVSGDLTSADARKETVEKTIDKFGKLDVLVCNAGAEHKHGGISDTTDESFDFVMNINLKSVFFLIQQALPYLETSKGNIVSISSIVSHTPIYPMIVYGMLKAGLDHMTRCLALDLAPKNIRVNTVNPSYAITGIIRVDTPEEISADEAFYKSTEEAKQPLGNRLVTLQELANAVAFLASDNASFITGQALTVDGGRSLNGPFVTCP